MSIDNFTDIFTLIAAIIGLLGCVFRYVDMPKRGWLYLSIFFLSHILSDYYWGIYSLVMQESPNVSEYVAYFGWNVGYLFVFLAVWHMSVPGSRRYFNPLMLIPIPLNVYQFTIYIEYGGLINNIIQVGLTTVTACFCLQGILYYFKHRKDGEAFPWLHTLVLAFITFGYGSWTSSCYAWPSDFLSPYYYCAVLTILVATAFSWGAKKFYERNGRLVREKSVSELKFQLIIQILVSIVIFGGCVVGYSVASRLKNSLPKGSENTTAFDNIAIILFIISIFMVLLVLGMLVLISMRYRRRREREETEEQKERGKFNLMFTVFVTLALMVFSVVYNSILYYDASVTAVYEDGENKAQVTATDMESYLSNANSTLWVTADTVDLMVKNGETIDKIREFMIEQTKNETKQFDENFTGLYAYIDGEYLDGTQWVPPAGYDPKSRSWYKEAVNARGETTIVPPYVDAQTNSVVITICKMLTNGDRTGQSDRANVVALDVIVNHIQEETETIDVDGKGYAMIVNKDGFIVSHKNKEYNGKNIIELGPDDSGLMQKIIDTKQGQINTEWDAENSTLFINSILDQWYVVIAVTDDELLTNAYSQVLMNVLVSMIIFALILFFYFLGYKNEQIYSKNMEEWKISKQKQEYESQVLLLEKQAADSANKAKSSFLADMSHEIRTPINAILGMNEMILREPDGEHVLEYAKNVETSGKNLLQLINGILDFSKIEDGKMEIVPVDYKLKSSITYLVNSIRERAYAKGLELVVNVDPFLPSELFGDDVRVNQVTMNLLTNAVKYTSKGTVTLTVEERDRTGDRVLLYVEVRDTGMGIRKEDMESLFESFKRLDEKKNRNIEGTGLGMSITTRLLELMDSKLNVKSQYGIGSVFSFELWQGIEDERPIGDYQISDADDEEKEKYRALFTAPDARILVVDDTRMNLIVVQNLIRDTKIHIDTASTGKAAIRMAEEIAYDVILMDQRMPGLDGTETMQIIRENENGKNTGTPIICLTADAIRGAKSKYLSQGFNDYLTKPVNGRDLEAMLQEYLPQDKVILGSDNDESASKAEKEKTDSGLHVLSKAGIDIRQGIRLCNNDEGFYRAILEEFAKDFVKRRENLKSYYENADWKNYNVNAHSLKSSASMIGAVKLSEKAALLESAAKDNDKSVIDAEHENAMDMYEDVVFAINELS